jgi:HPt (histidine-containing phosphotransfer) domain-containing protein
MSVGSAPLFDPTQLDRRAMGDESLRTELLALFATELERLMRQAEFAADAVTRDERLRAISALARSVGAVRLAQTAKLLETQFTVPEIDLDPLRDVVVETLAYLRQTGA